MLREVDVFVYGYGEWSFVGYCVDAHWLIAHHLPPARTPYTKAHAFIWVFKRRQG